MELENMKGTIVGVNKEKEGTNKKGDPWTLWKVKLMTRDGERTLSGFIDPTEFMNKFVNITYKEAPNPQGEYPFKNIVKIDNSVSEEEVKQSDDQYKLTDVKKMPEPAPFYGMIFNQTCEFINNNPDLNFDKNFDVCFNKLWDLAIKKRKDKLGY